MDTTPRFIWPPARLTGEDVGHRGVDQIAIESIDFLARPVRSAFQRRWLEIEDFWFDRTMGPLRDEIDSIGWRPDSPAAYCDRCGRDVGIGEASEIGCSRCRDSRLPWDFFVRLCPYRGPVVDWIHQLKFQRRRDVARELGSVLGRLLAVAAESASVRPGQIMVCPVPTTFRRRMGRGIDHAGALARSVAKSLGAQPSRLLSRTHRPSQRAVPMSKRAENVRGAVRVRASVGDDTRVIVLVDDVVTSGSTVRACARALRREFGERGTSLQVWVAAIAVAGSNPSGGRR